MVLYIPINSDMELYRDWGHLFIHESPLRFYVKCGCIQKGHLSLFGRPEARANPNPHGKFCLGISS